MLSLTISGKPINIIPLENGGEIWTNIVIDKFHRDREGLWIGLREFIVNLAIERRVKFFHIKVKETGEEFSIKPEEFKESGKFTEKESKYPNSAPFKILLYKVK
jgi:hypothetical protein